MIYMKQNYVEIVREVNFKTNYFRNQASLHQESKYLELRNIPLSYHSEVRSENRWHHAVNKRSNLNVLSHAIASVQRLSFYIFLLYPGCVPIYIKKKNWLVGGIHFLTDFLIFTSNPTIMTELMTLYDLGLHVFARWVDKLPATCWKYWLFEQSEQSFTYFMCL